MTDCKLRSIGTALIFASIGATAFASNIRHFETPMHLFDQVCLPAIERQDFSNLNGLDAFSEDQKETYLEHFASLISEPQLIEKIYAAKVGDGHMVLLDMGQPGQCLLANITTKQVATNSLPTDMMNYFSMGGSDFRWKHPPSVSGRAPGRYWKVSSGWAYKPVEDGFVQLSAQHYRVEVPNQPIWNQTIIMGVRVGKTPASCEIWPEECS